MRQTDIEEEIPIAIGKTGLSGSQFSIAHPRANFSTSLEGEGDTSGAALATTLMVFSMSSERPGEVSSSVLALRA
jgi:hypothetical protein